MRNIVVDNNLFKCYDKGIMRIQCTDGVQFTNNTIELTDAYPRHNLVENSFDFTNCKNVKISGNNMSDEFKTVHTAYCDEAIEIQ